MLDYAFTLIMLLSKFIYVVFPPVPNMPTPKLKETFIRMQRSADAKVIIKQSKFFMAHLSCDFF